MQRESAARFFWIKGGTRIRPWMTRQLGRRDGLLCGNVQITGHAGAWIGKKFDWLVNPEGP